MMTPNENKQTLDPKPLARAAARLRGDTGGKSPRRRSPRRRPRKQIVKLRPGPAGLDLRSSGAIALNSWRRELIEHVGGQQVISVPERLLVERIISTELYVQDIDRVLLGLPSIVTTGNRLLDLVKERQTLVDSQARLLDRLGLRSTERPARSLADLMAEVAAESSPGAVVPDLHHHPVVGYPGGAQPAVNDKNLNQDRAARGRPGRPPGLKGGSAAQGAGERGEAEMRRLPRVDADGVADVGPEGAAADDHDGTILERAVDEVARLAHGLDKLVPGDRAGGLGVVGGDDVGAGHRHAGAGPQDMAVQRRGLLAGTEGERHDRDRGSGSHEPNLHMAK